MIHLLNINDSSNAALVRMCKERGVSPNVLLSNIVTESIRALVSERALSIDNILNPVGLAADLIRSTMNEAEFAEFCETDVTIDDMEEICPMLVEAGQRGLETVDGLAMLIGQAAVAFEKFFGAPAPREHDADLRKVLTA